MGLTGAIDTELTRSIDWKPTEEGRRELAARCPLASVPRAQLGLAFLGRPHVRDCAFAARDSQHRFLVVVLQQVVLARRRVRNVVHARARRARQCVGLDGAELGSARLTPSPATTSLPTGLSAAACNRWRAVSTSAAARMKLGCFSP